MFQVAHELDSDPPQLAQRKTNVAHQLHPPRFAQQFKASFLLWAQYVNMPRPVVVGVDGHPPLAKTQNGRHSA